MGGLWDELNPVAGRERSRHVALGNQRCLLPVHLHSFIANPRQVLHLKCESLSCRLHLPLLCSFLCYGCVRVCETGARVQSYCPAVAGIKRFSWCLVIVVQPLDMCLWQSATKTYSHQLGTTQLSLLIVINAHMYPQHLPPCCLPSSLVPQLKLAPLIRPLPSGVKVDTVIKLSGASSFYNWI